MSMIWLVGIRDAWLDEFADVLSGFFAVRKVASLRSFSRLLALTEAPRNEGFLCVVRLSSSDDLMAIHASMSQFGRECPQARVCVIGEISSDQKKLLETLKIAALGLPEDMVQTAKLLRSLMAAPTQSPLIGAEFIRIGDIEVDREASCLRVLATGVEEPLTPKEIKILQVLSSAVNQSITREDLIRKVWIGTRVSASTVDSHMSRLRKKIEHSFECALETRYGTGWMLSHRGSAAP